MAIKRMGLIAVFASSIASGGMRSPSPAYSQDASHRHAVDATQEEQIPVYSLAPRGGLEAIVNPSAASPTDEPRRLIVREGDLDIAIQAGAPEEYQALRRLPGIEEVKFGLPETVCGADDRAPITNTTQSPYNANCLLLMELPNNSGRARGTGWLINGTTVVTAGHCVHDGGGGPFYPSIEVIPGAFVARVNGVDVLQRPYGSQTVTESQLRASDGWKTSSSMADDYGAILLNAPFSGPSGSPQPLSAAVLSDVDLQNAQLHVSGYPGDKPTGTQWEHDGPVAGVEPARLRYMIDTFGGQSGSSVALRRNGRLTTVGIHNYGGCPNRCTRITQGVQTDLQRWQAEMGGSASPAGGASANGVSETPVFKLERRQQ